MEKDMLIKRNNGFTLVEVMIVVAIIAIIAALAVPAYQNHIRKAERAAAQAKMLELSGLLENNYLQRGQYVRTYIAAVNADPDLSTSPNRTAPRYNFVIAANDANNQTFTITARPVGPQIGDRCGVMTINNANQTTAETNDCW